MDRSRPQQGGNVLTKPADQLNRLNKEKAYDILQSRRNGQPMHSCVNVSKVVRPVPLKMSAGWDSVFSRVE